MKNILTPLIVLLSIALAFPYFTSAQDSFSDDFGYEVKKIYPYISISKEKLQEAQSLCDFKNEANGLNLEYKSSWIKEYISVEFIASQNGEIKKAVNKSDKLSQEQKDLINKADTGTEIAVNVKYIPDNNLKHNDPKDLDFRFVVNPDNKAAFPGGQEALNQYLKEKAIDKISEGSFEGYDLSAIKFTISEEGEITNAHVFASEYPTNNEKVNELLLETVRNMPCWKPAEYRDGTKVEQEYVFTVGNMRSCVVNMLNIQRD